MEIVLLLAVSIILFCACQNSWEKLIKGTIGYSIGMAICESIVYVLSIAAYRFGVHLPDIMQRDTERYAESIQEGSFLGPPVWCLVIIVLCGLGIYGLIFSNFAKVGHGKRVLLILICVIHALTSCLFTGMAVSIVSVSFLLSSLYYAVGIYKYCASNHEEVFEKT